jgi:hypothetical protein
MISDFKLVIRNPTDCGKKRTEATPSKDQIESNIKQFLQQWKTVSYEGTKIIPQVALEQIDKLLVHVRKGCLTGIEPSGGTSRNEGIHRVLNKTLKKSRIGIQFALAILGIFFYKWNEKQLTVHKKQRNIRVVPPIESHFNAKEVRRTDCTETFGEKYHHVLPKVPESSPDTPSSNDGEQQTTTTDMVNNLNDCVQNDYSSSSDEDEQSYSKHGSDTTTASLTDRKKNDIISSSKSMEQLCAHIRSVGHGFERFNPKMAMFAESSLTLLNNDLQSKKQPVALDNVLTNYNMVRVNISPNGDCFFLSVAYALLNDIIPNQNIPSDAHKHLDTIGLIKETSYDANDMSSTLRILIVREWMNNPDQYKPFLDSQIEFETEASLFLNGGHFASQLGNSMPLAMANVLKIPMVVMTQMDNFSIIPITPRESLQSLPVFIAFDHTGAGHYDAVMQVQPSEPTSENSTYDCKKEVSPDGCRCGQGAKKKEAVISSCDQFKKRCKCFQSITGCTEKCQCLGCKNPYGKNTAGMQMTATGTRKRRSSGITTQLKSGSEFVLKQPCISSVNSWSFLEEVILAKLIHDDIDLGVIHMQYMEFVDNKDIFPKSQQQVTGKVVSYLNDNELFKTLLKEQVRLNWFI